MSAEEMVTQFAPRALAQALQKQPPVTVRMGQETLDLRFEEKGPGELVAQSDSLQVTLRHDYVSAHSAIRWIAALTNQGVAPLTDLSIIPLLLRLDADPLRDTPRARHLSGSNHYDGTYPPRAFRESEELLITHDHCKPVRIEGGAMGSAFQDVPLLQFAVGRDGAMSGFTVGFEWSGFWFLEAAWERNSFEGESRPALLVQGNVGLNAIRLEPGETLELPRVHLVFAEAEDWQGISNGFRRYVLESLTPNLQGDPPMPPVSYDHWFGIHMNFDVRDMMRQAERAAEMGCEYFCLDAGWYKCNHWSDGIGNWFTPDPKKFPEGVEVLSEHVRRLGMRFGLWHMFEQAAEGSDFLTRYPHLYTYEGSPSGFRFDLPEAREAALERLRYWCDEWQMRWTRWECRIPAWLYEADPTGKLAVAYLKGHYEVIDTLRREYPDLYVEGCQGGGTRFDLGMVVRTHGTWLSDHTAHPEVCRYFQTGALRLWPARYLNSAVRVHRNTGDQEVFAHNFLSRMVGTFSFNGDIAQWSAEAARRAKEYVEVYKQVRHLLNQPVFFPLPQPRAPREWDAVVFGDGAGAGQLLFVFRMEGKEEIVIDTPGGSGLWNPLMGPAEAKIARIENSGTSVSLPPYSSALWRR